MTQDALDKALGIEPTIEEALVEKIFQPWPGFEVWSAPPEEFFAIKATPEQYQAWHKWAVQYVIDEAGVSESDAMMTTLRVFWAWYPQIRSR